MRSSTISYSTSIQCMCLSDTVSMLETSSGFGEIESTEIPRPFSSQTVPHRFTSTWKVALTSDSHFRPNRKWKCGGNHIVELATIDFLFDIRPQYNVWVCWAPFRRWKLLPVSAKSKVLKFHVHSVHKRFRIGSRTTGKWFLPPTVISAKPEVEIWLSLIHI